MTKRRCFQCLYLGISLNPVNRATNGHKAFIWCYDIWIVSANIDTKTIPGKTIYCNKYCINGTYIHSSKLILISFEVHKDIQVQSRLTSAYIIDSDYIFNYTNISLGSYLTYQLCITLNCRHIPLAVSLNIFYSGIKYAEKDWVRLKAWHYPLQDRRLFNQ